MDHPIRTNVTRLHAIPTAQTKEDDEYSDENIKRWIEEDKLDPKLAEWLKAQLED